MTHDLPALRVMDDAYDAVDRADAVLVATAWEGFIALDLEKVQRRIRSDLFVDGRNLFDPDCVAAAGLLYDGVGRGARRTVIDISV